MTSADFPEVPGHMRGAPALPCAGFAIAAAVFTCPSLLLQHHHNEEGSTMCRYAYRFHSDCQHHSLVLVEYCEKAVPAVAPAFLVHQLREYTSSLSSSPFVLSETVQLSSAR